MYVFLGWNLGSLLMTGLAYFLRDWVKMQLSFAIISLSLILCYFLVRVSYKNGALKFQVRSFLRSPNHPVGWCKMEILKEPRKFTRKLLIETATSWKERERIHLRDIFHSWSRELKKQKPQIQRARGTKKIAICNFWVKVSRKTTQNEKNLVINSLL